MNRRQRKKAFKKVFEMTPAQYEKWYREHWCEIMSEVIRRNADVLNEGLKEWGREVADAVETVKAGIDKWAEAIRVTEGSIEILQEGEEKDGKDGIDP